MSDRRVRSSLPRHQEAQAEGDRQAEQLDQFDERQRLVERAGGRMDADKVPDRMRPSGRPRRQRPDDHDHDGGDQACRPDEVADAMEAPPGGGGRERRAEQER
ncbi:hypothetical protein [Phenylobacterium sp. J367]|uniref:hypothetical protein n=1 Tax=Phenylobacterium sp. J367 TaxID=2898435 RepID=UPI002151A760|nr:hypothetical protein [Phenylobacterium sp. J367]MCR5879519.1 hypothetical protein [Phenylobacterium sp. J367]